MRVEIITGFTADKMTRYGDLRVLLNTVDGSKVYYDLEGIFEKYVESFMDYPIEEHNSNTLPRRLKECALIGAYGILVSGVDSLMAIYELVSDLPKVEIVKAFGDYKDSHSHLINKYNSLQEVR